MNIRLIRKSNSQLLQQSKVGWELFYKRYNYRYFYFLVFGLSIFLYGIFINHIDGQFWNFFTSLGISFLLIFILIINNKQNAKRKFFLKVEKLIQKFEENNNVTEITINETMIKYKTFETYSEMNWPYYKFYQFYKGHLFFFTDKSSFSNMAIQKDELAKEEFDELLKFIKSHLMEKNNSSPEFKLEANK